MILDNPELPTTSANPVPDHTSDMNIDSYINHNAQILAEVTGTFVFYILADCINHII